MSREATLILIGLLVIVSPFSGLPVSWLQWLLPVLGIIVAVIGYSLRMEKVRHQKFETATAQEIRGVELSA
jgi:hypothetical protein